MLFQVDSGAIEGGSFFGGKEEERDNKCHLVQINKSRARNSLLHSPASNFHADWWSPFPPQSVSYHCQIVGCEIAATNHSLIEHDILIRLVLLVGLISVEEREREETKVECKKKFILITLQLLEILISRV